VRDRPRIEQCSETRALTRRAQWQSVLGASNLRAVFVDNDGQREREYRPGVVLQRGDALSDKARSDPIIGAAPLEIRPFRQVEYALVVPPSASVLIRAHDTDARIGCSVAGTDDQGVIRRRVVGHDDPDVAIRLPDERIEAFHQEAPRVEDRQSDRHERAVHRAGAGKQRFVGRGCVQQGYGGNAPTRRDGGGGGDEL